MQRFALFLTFCSLACAGPDAAPLPDPDVDTFAGKGDGTGCLEPGTPHADGVLALVNDPDVDAEELDASVSRGGAGLDRRAAYGIVDARPLATVAELDAVPWVGPAACEALARYACNVDERCRRPVTAMTWNVEHFPLTDETEDAVVEVLEQLEPDVVGLQEIEHLDAFERIMDRLPGYDGLLAEPGPFTRVAVLVRRSTMELQGVEDLFVEDWFAFPRPVLAATVRPAGSDAAFELLNLHLKARGDDSSEDRRRTAVGRLRDLLAQRRENGRGAALILGDWNDELTDTAPDNVFTALSEGAGASFLTLAAEEAGFVSYVPWSRMLDHVMVTDELLTQLDHRGTEVLELDQTWRADFVDVVSDHRPVLSSFDVAIAY